MSGIVRTLLVLALSALLILAALALLGGWQVRVSPVAFLAMLSLELMLLHAVVAAPARSSTARLAMFVLPVAVAVGCRIYQAIATQDLLDWDETYYLSMAVTAADGRGLYPYVYGYSPMAIMGGTGYAAYAYALAVDIAGPTLVGLRVVSLLASLAGLWGLWVLMRMWYGTATAWMAVALTSALRLFVLSNTARPDSMTFAYVIGSMVVSAVAFKHWEARRWHLLAGLAFGLGLQVHIDTVVTAIAIGVAYVVAWLRQIRAERRVPVPHQMLSYVAGWSLGLAVFVAFNILPNPEAFYNTTVRVRVDATGWYSSGTTSLLGSFLNPGILLSKELERYSVLFRAVPRIEVILVGVALVALLVRRTSVDRHLATVIAAVVVVASVVLNNASVLYFIHVLPALILPIAPLLTHGFTGQSTVSTGQVRFTSLLAFSIVVSALVAVNSARSIRSPRPASLQDAADAALTGRVRAVAGPDCIIAGDAGLYVRHFADYKFFISTRPTEVTYAMLYRGLKDEAEYWRTKAPEVIVAREPLSPGLASYVAHSRLQQVEDRIWVAPGGCNSARRQSR